MVATSPQVRIEKIRSAEDVRGSVFEPLHAAELRGQSNVHVVLTGPGHVRGNHVHRIGTEISTVVGSARVCYREGDEPVTIDVPLGEIWRFVFPPGVAHAFRNSGDTPMLIVSFNTVAHDPQQPDTTRVELL